MSTISNPETFTDLTADPPVRGFLHRPGKPSGDGLVLTHGAGSNCQSPLLTALSEVFADAGFTVLRCDLPYRQARSFGPPGPGDAKRDRAGLKNAVAALKTIVSGRLFVGGHSYGGRQGSMLCADEPDLGAGLLLLSYPLHPPKTPTAAHATLLQFAHARALRTGHARSLRLAARDRASAKADPRQNEVVTRRRRRPRLRIPRKVEAGGTTPNSIGRISKLPAVETLLATSRGRHGTT